jgi:hypothetical protein
MAKAKPKTGAAMPDDQEPDDSDQTPGGITDAQAANLNTGGFSATPEPPTGPTLGSGISQGDDFARKVAAATNVPSKGGPAVESLYASSGKGPVGRLKAPQESGVTSQAPDYRAQPNLMLNQGSVLDMPDTSSPAPSAIPATQPQPGTIDQSQPAAAQPATDQSAQPDLPPAFKDHGAQIEAKAKPYQLGNQDYSQLPEYITQDPRFAGLDNGVPIFMDEQGRVYMKDELEPGKETRHYADAAYGSKEAKEGVTVTDPIKVAANQQAIEQLPLMLQAQDAINQWKQLQTRYLAMHPGGEGMLQRMALEAKMSGDTGWQATIMKTLAGMVPGVTPDMEQLEAARNNMTVPFMSTFEKGKEGLRIPGTSVQGMPTANDDFQTQMAKVQAMQQHILNQARVLRAISPDTEGQVRKLLQMVQTGGAGSGQPGGNQNAPAGSVARPGGTTGGSSSGLKEVKSQADYDSLSPGDQYTFQGRTFTKGRR